MKTKQITALLIGSTGLVGSQILDQLLTDSRFETVKTFSRRASGHSHQKLIEVVADFKDIDLWGEQLKGDVLFSALGTTRAQAGSVKAQRLVDYDYQYQVARYAKTNGVSGYALISSAGASPGSLIPYSRMKGELERDTLLLGFDRIRILRPGPLKGRRTQPRPMEHLTLKILDWAPKIPGLETLVPVADETVARASIASLFDESVPERILEPKDILNYGA